MFVNVLYSPQKGTLSVWKVAADSGRIVSSLETDFRVLHFHDAEQAGFEGVDSAALKEPGEVIFWGWVIMAALRSAFDPLATEYGISNNVEWANQQPEEMSFVVREDELAAMGTLLRPFFDKSKANLPIVMNYLNTAVNHGHSFEACRAAH